MNHGSNVADFPMIADPIDFKKAMFDQKQMLENPDLAQPRYQRAARRTADAARGADATARRIGPRRRAHRGGCAAPPRPRRRRRRPPAATSPTDELAATLERLAGLRDKGLITPEEYEVKKAQILERM